MTLEELKLLKEIVLGSRLEEPVIKKGLRILNREIKLREMDPRKEE